MKRCCGRWKTPPPPRSSRAGRAVWTRASRRGGKGFSGGQRQRLTVARALVKAAPILILDDAASALDFATERRLRQTLSALPERPCVFTVSQRASSVRDCDVILVLEDGRLIGAGDHESLLKENEVYAEICRTAEGDGAHGEKN